MSAGGSCTADALPVAALAALHVFSGAIERVLFARLAASMPHSVLLMHTQHSTQRWNTQKKGFGGTRED